MAENEQQTFIFLVATVAADGALDILPEHEIVPVKCDIGGLTQALNMVEEGCGRRVLAILPKLVALGLPEIIHKFEAQYDAAKATYETLQEGKSSVS